MASNNLNKRNSISSSILNNNTVRNNPENNSNNGNNDGQIQNPPIIEIQNFNLDNAGVEVPRTNNRPAPRGRARILSDASSNKDKLAAVGDRYKDLRMATSDEKPASSAKGDSSGKRPETPPPPSEERTRTRSRGRKASAAVRDPKSGTVRGRKGGSVRLPKGGSTRSSVKGSFIGGPGKGSFIGRLRKADRDERKADCNHDISHLLHLETDRGEAKAAQQIRTFNARQYLPERQDQLAGIYALMRHNCRKIKDEGKAVSDVAFAPANGILSRLIKTGFEGCADRAARSATEMLELFVVDRSSNVLAVQNSTYGIGAYANDRSKDCYGMSPFYTIRKLGDRDLLVKQLNKSKDAEKELDIADEAKKIRHHMRNTSVSMIDKLMEDMFGNPNDPAEIKSAVARIKAEARNQLAVLWKAIDDLKLDDADATKELKRKVAAKCLVSDALDPDLGQRGRVSLGGQEQRQSLGEFRRAMLSLVRGDERIGGEDGYEGLQEAGKHLKQKWFDGFYGFAEAIVANADAKLVDDAVAEGRAALSAAEKADDGAPGQDG